MVSPEAVIKSISSARLNPAALVETLQRRLGHFQGHDYHPPERRGARVCTKEGDRAVRGAIEFLLRQPPVGGLDPERGVGLRYAAEDHCIDRGGSGTVGHTGADGSLPSDRQSRYGKFSGRCGECLWFGRPDATAAQIVLELIIDDGVASRSHRKAIFDSSFRVAGGCAGSHCTFGCCVVIELAAAYVDDAGRSAERARTGPPRPAAHSGPVQTQWGRSLGLCSLCHNPILGGSVIETRDGTYHRDCYRCDGCGVDLKGQQVANCNGRPCCLSCAKRGVQVDCSGCGKPIAGTVLRVAGKPWHRQCLDAWGMAASGRRIRMASGSR